jgi:hypothetical protein
VITFENIHKNKTANIIGKGTSINRLKLCDIKDGFIIAINQAVLKVEEIGTMLHVYSLQKDGSSPELRDNCYCKLNGLTECPYEMVRPKRATLINHKEESPCCMEDYSPRIIFNNEDFGLEWMMPSALSAIKIAKYFGANKIRMIGFDSITEGKNDNFATDKIDGGYETQHQGIRELLSDIEHEFIRL